MLLRRRRAKWQGKEVFQGRVTKAERASMEEIQDGSGWVQGPGHKQRLQDERRSNVQVRAVQAWSKRLLQQALGVGTWHPHGADRVQHGQLNKKKP